MQGFEIDPDFPFNLIFFKIKKKTCQEELVES